MNIRLCFLIPLLTLTGAARLGAQETANTKHFSFSKLPGDDQICDWLKEVSPAFRDAYDAIAKRKYVKHIRFQKVAFDETAFNEVGVFYVDGGYEIRLSDKLTGAERVKTLAYEIANAYLNEEHQQIDAAAREGFLNAREYAIAHEIYEYEAWRVYRTFLFDLEKQLGVGNLPAGLFYGTATARVSEYRLPNLNHFLKHMEESRHMKHYLDWFEKHYSDNQRRKK